MAGIGEMKYFGLPVNLEEMTANNVFSRRFIRRLQAEDGLNFIAE